MAYPFAPCPTFAEFKARLAEAFNCKYLELEGKLVDPQGNQWHVFYFERTTNGEVLRIPARDLPDTERVIYTVTRRICNRLKIDPAAFGLDLG